jgi:hypothetical protein
MKAEANGTKIVLQVGAELRIGKNGEIILRWPVQYPRAAPNDAAARVVVNPKVPQIASHEQGKSQPARIS